MVNGADSTSRLARAQGEAGQTKGLIKIIIECQTSWVFNFTGQKIERTEHQKNRDNIAKNQLMTLIADTSGVKLQF